VPPRRAPPEHHLYRPTLRRAAGQLHVTRRLGDSIHAYAVMAALAAEGRADGFVAYRPFVPLFANGPLTVSASDHGTQWWSSHQPFRGPQHGEHVRDTMARCAGVIDGSLLGLELAAMVGTPGHVRPYVVVCPDAGAAYKEWPRECWGAVMEHALCRYDVLVCGMPGRPRIPAPAGATHLDVSVATLATLAAGAQVLIGPDSGHLHLADALGTRVIGLYGATSSVTYGPYRDRAWCIDTHAAHAPTNGRYNSARHGSGSQMCSIRVDRVVDMLDQVSGRCRAGNGPRCQPDPASPLRFAAEPPDGD
jgi:hypothetical protein